MFMVVATHVKYIDKVRRARWMFEHKNTVWPNTIDIMRSSNITQTITPRKMHTCQRR